MKEIAKDGGHLRGMSDAAPLYALILLTGGIALIAALIGGLWFALH